MTLAVFFGKTTIVKVLDLFLKDSGSEYSKTGIAFNSGISRQSVYTVLNKLLRYRVLVPSRKLGNMTFYKLNVSNPIVLDLRKISILLSGIEK